ncbi:MAG: ABC transporter ATP-binding protein [Planctomycetota bacterium]
MSDAEQLRSGRASGKRYDAYLDRRRERASKNELHIPDRGDDGPDRGGATRYAHLGRKRSRNIKQILGAFWRISRGHHGTLIAALATLSVSTLIGMVMPASTKIVMDFIWADTPGPEALAEFVPIPRRPDGSADRVAMLWIVGGGMIVLTSVAVLISMWGRWQATRVTKRLQVSFRRTLFEHAVHLPLHRVQAIKSGGVASILREDAGGVGELVFSLIYNPWRAITQVAVTLVILAAVEWTMLVGALFAVPVIWITHRTWIGRIRPIYRDVRGSRTAIDSHSTEVFGGMRIVRGFNRWQGESQRFVGENHYMVRQEILAWWWSRSVEIVWALLIPVASTAVLVYGGWRVISGELTPGDVIMFVTYVVMLLGPLEALASSATQMQNNLSALDKTLDLLDEPREFAESDKQDSSPVIELDRAMVQGAVDISNVTFAYPTAGSADEPTPVITDLSLAIEPGETIALVGPSGAGKTTICNLVARFYDPSSGSIRFDGTDLKDIDVDSYRRLLGIVEQDVFLFDGTIAENIAYAKRDATEAEILRAAELANAHEFIVETDHGYDALIGERGVRLSGGQKQRLAIARAILADPALLILDEATSNLDSRSESLIQRSLTDLMKGRTSIVIAHRLSTIRHADRIAVLEKGKLIELGTHSELLERDGLYAAYLRMQLNPEETQGVELLG